MQENFVLMECGERKVCHHCLQFTHPSCKGNSYQENDLHGKNGKGAVGQRFEGRLHQCHEDKVEVPLGSDGLNGRI